MTNEREVATKLVKSLKAQNVRLWRVHEAHVAFIPLPEDELLESEAINAIADTLKRMHTKLQDN